MGRAKRVNLAAADGIDGLAFTLQIEDRDTGQTETMARLTGEDFARLVSGRSTYLENLMESEG